MDTTFSNHSDHGDQQSNDQDAGHSGHREPRMYSPHENRDCDAAWAAADERVKRLAVMTTPNRSRSRTLSDAVTDLVDGLGGDEQENERAIEIGRD